MGGGPVTYYVKPVPTPPLCAWGFYPSGRVHNALDYPTPVGTPFRCAANGVVTVASWSSTGFGNHIRVKLDDGNTVIYGHLSRYGCRVGQRVYAGQIIGFTGNTGNSTGPHLHMEVRQYSWLPFTAWNFTSRLINYGSTPTTTTSVSDEEFDMSIAQYISDQVKAVAGQVTYVQKQVKAVAGQVSGLAAEVAELRAKVDALPADVWKVTVARGDRDVPVIQEVADAKTNTEKILEAGAQP